MPQRVIWFLLMLIGVASALRFENYTRFECTPAEYGTFKYVSIMTSDGSTRLIGIRCIPPILDDPKVGYLPDDDTVVLPRPV